jgi:muconolactone D-isomerase
MLFHVRMQVHLPADLDAHQRDELIAAEKAYSQRLQRAGQVAAHLAYRRRVFDVDSNDELHQLISGLPLFPYMDIHVTPSATHPSDIHQ